MSLDAIAGSPTANSYVTLANATGYLAGRLYTEPWFALPTSPTLEDVTWRNSSALIWATRLLDEQVAWFGMPTTITQALGWPRSGVVDRQGRTVASDTVPVTIQMATTFYALALLRDTSEVPTATDSTVKVKVMDDVRIEYFDPSTARLQAPRTALPKEIVQMLLPYGQTSGGVAVPLLRT